MSPKRSIPVLVASRLQRWAIQLSAYQYDIRYRSSQQNANADMLSRLPLPVDQQPDIPGIFSLKEMELCHVNQLKAIPITSHQLQHATQKDPVLSRVLYYVVNGWPKEVDPELQPYLRVGSELTLEAGCLLRGVRVVIPECFQTDILSDLHVGHPGIVRMKSLARMFGGLVWTDK